MKTTTTGKRRERGEANRARIVAVARSLFEARGFEAVTVRDVAFAAERSTGSIFVHFRDKEDLFAAAMGRPYLNDARGAELLAVLDEVAPKRAAYFRSLWAGAPAVAA
jgi:AcrR family transcriptional regulator